MRLDFIGANPDVRPQGQAPTETVVSYFKGDPSQWKTGLPTYGEVVYEELWPGIDLVYSGTQDRLEYTFLVNPGADPSRIKLAYRGPTSVEVNAAGELEVETPGGGFHDAAPVSYQEIAGKQVEVATKYAMTKTNTASESGVFSYGFDVAGYDARYPLVIDPTIFIYAGFIGGDGNDFGNGVAVGPSGGAYVVGYTSSTEASFPDGGGIGALPGYDGTYNGGLYDAYVAKVRANGTGLVYVSYLGGFADDFADDVAVNSAGEAFVVGSTTSPDFPTFTGPDLNFGGGYEAFVLRLNSKMELNSCYSGFIGGTGTDAGHSIALGPGGAAYVTGLDRLGRDDVSGANRS